MKLLNLLLSREVYVFNKEDNGGEALSIIINYYDNGDAAHGLPDGVYDNHQELTLQSYGNSASFNLCNGFTPENLRELANIMENGYNIALSKVIKKDGW